MATRAGKVLSRELDLYNEFWAIVRANEPVKELNPLNRFVVIENTPGYLPEEDEPALFDTEKEAWDYLMNQVMSYVDDLIEAGVDVKTTVDREHYWVGVEDGGLGRDFSVNSTEPCGAGFGG